MLSTGGMTTARAAESPPATPSAALAAQQQVLSLSRIQVIQEMGQWPAKLTPAQQARAFELVRWALYHQQTDIFERLVPARVAMDARDDQGYTLPMWMAIYGQPRWISRWPAGQLRQATATGETPLSLAIDRGHSGMVRVLLQAGAGEPKWLSYAVLQGKSEVLPAFFRFGFDPTQAPEIYAAAVLSPSVESVQTLARYGVDFRQGSLTEAQRKSLEPLFSSVLAADERVVTDWLVSWDPAWLVPIAGALGQKAEALPLQREQWRQALLNRQTPANFFQNQAPIPLAYGPGSTATSVPPMMQAASVNAVTQLEILLSEEGGDVNRGDLEGRTPLWAAAQAGQLEAVNWLLTHGAQINQRTRQLRTPLMAASAHGHLEVVKRLLEAGAQAHLTDYQGLRAIDYARQPDQGTVNPVLLQLLTDAAADS